MVRKKRRYSGLVALVALILFAPLVATAYELPSFEYDSSIDLSYAGRMAQDLDGNVYVADSRRGRVYVFDKYGRAASTIETIAQSAVVATSSAGEVYVASPHGVYVLGDNGQSNSVVGQDEVVLPVDMEVDASGQIYVVDGGSHTVKVFSGAGVSLGEFAGGAGLYPVSLAMGRDSVSGEELIYVGYSVETTDASNTEAIIVYNLDFNLVRSFAPAVQLLSWRESVVAAGSVTKAGDITVDDAGRVYVAAPYAGRVSVYSEQGDFLRDYVLPGSVAPYAVLYDVYGRLFVSTFSGSVEVFLVDGNDVPNVVPTAPSLVSPVGGGRIGTASPELVAGNSSDPNGDNLVYEFEVASNPSMSLPVWSSGPVAEGGDGYTATAVDVVLSEDADYYWRVRSFDGVEYSRYSYVTRFFVNAVNTAPVIASYSPASGIVGGVAVGEAVQFDLLVDEPDRDKIIISWFLNGVEVSTGPVYSYLAASSEVGENVVSVVVDDGELSVGRQWGVTVMRPNTAPTAPALNEPVGSGDVSTLRPELSVSNAFDAEGDLLTYVFEVSATDNFGEIVATLSGITPDANLAMASIDVDLVENGLYYWRAKACEVEVAGSFVETYYCGSPSDTGSFVVNTVNDPVGAPAIASPANGLHVNTIDGRLVLAVDNAQDADLNDAIVYDFEVALDKTFATVLSSNEGVAEGASGSTSVPVVGTFEENRTYYWRVRAADAESTSAWVESSFFVDNYNDAPTVPLVDLANSGAESVSVNPVLSVINSEDLNGDTLSYVFEIDSADNFSSPAKQVSGLVAEALSLTSWRVDVQLDDNTSYYWRAKASDGVSESAWSAVQKVFVNQSNDAPGAPVVKSPSDGVAVNVENPELVIYGASDVDGDKLEYAYQLSRADSFAEIEGDAAGEGLAWKVDFNLEENVIYYWRARAVDEHGLPGAWSDTAKFMVNVVNENPGVPVASSYSYSADEEVLLKIGAAVDPDADTLVYSVELYSDRSMGTLAYAEDGLTGDEEIVCNVGSLKPGVYYWRVRAYDGKLYGSWSDTRVIKVNASGAAIFDGTEKAHGRKRF